MTEPLTTRGPFNQDPGLTVEWMLQSGQEVERVHPGVPRYRAGIQLYLPHGNQVAVLQLDADGAHALIDALTDHVANISPVHVPAPDTQVQRNLKAVQEELARPLELKRRPTPPPIRDAIGVDPEFLAAMEEVVKAWTGAYTQAARFPVDHHTARAQVLQAFPVLAAALDRLANLNA